MRLLAAIACLLLPLTVVAQRPYPAPCTFSLQRPEPTQNEPFIASGFIDLASSLGGTQPTNYTYRAYRKACPGGGAVALVRLEPNGIPDGFRPQISIVQGATTRSRVAYGSGEFGKPESTWSQDQKVGVTLTAVINEPGVDYTRAFTLRIGGASISTGTVTVQFPDFDPSQYPAASEPVPISRFIAGTWFDPARSGEGILLQLAPGDILVVGWFTFDQNGAPFWLFGGQPLCPNTGFLCPPGPRNEIAVDLSAIRGGGFAGNFNPANTQTTPWGRITIRQPTCDALSFTITQTHTLPTLPSASGVRNWSRFTGVSGIECR